MVRNLSIIIPAAGAGRRMKSYGPKSLVELNSRDTVLGRQIRILRSIYPDADITVVIGHSADTIAKVIPAGVKIVENELHEETNVLRSIGMGLRVATQPNVLVVYGDLVFNKETVLNVTMRGSSVIVDSKDRISDEEVGVTVVDNRITNFSYGLDVKWAQIAYLTGKELQLFKKAAWHKDHRRWLGHEGLNRVLDMGGKLRAIEPKGMQLVEIDSSRDIEKAMKV